MTNGEFYKEELFDLEETGKMIAIVKGKPEKCAEASCDECERHIEVDEIGRCSALKFTEWFNSEHTPPKRCININNRQKLFLESLQYGYLFRDAWGSLYYNKSKQTNGKDEDIDLGGIEHIIGSFGFIPLNEYELWPIKYILENAEVEE